LLLKPRFQLLITFFVISLIVIGFGASTREIYALPLLLPLAVLAGGSVETLKRGAASALNWFGLILFGMIGFLIWLGWFAMMTGWPEKLAERMQFLSSIHHPVFNWIGFVAAFLITLIWLAVVINAKRSIRAAVTDWAVGITMAWSLLMALWLPWIDTAKSYGPVMSSMQKALPSDYHCMMERNLGNSQYALLDYYLGIRPHTAESHASRRCDLYLIQDERGKAKFQPGPEWNMIWHGKRATDRRESFRLYQRS
jgi:4-amino-4-deoxy-L-arabinose transferase-like glycosyltransferase